MIKLKLYLTLIFSLILVLPLFAQERPQISYLDLVLSAEEDFNNVRLARELAAEQNLPHTIYLSEGIFIEAQGIENGKVVYAVMYNIAKPVENGETLFYSEIESTFNLNEARIHWDKKETQNPNLGYDYTKTTTEYDGAAPSFLLVPESTNDAVVTLDAVTGDLINSSYILDPTNLSTPIEALLAPTSVILLSDQLNDVIVEYDTFGVFTRILFGGNTAVLDNCRGIEIRPGANSVVGTIGGGANDDAVPEFDLITGNYLGNFIANGAGGLDSPFDIIFRSSDCLVGGINSDAIHIYDLTGASIGIFSSIDSFPEQLDEVLNGNIAVANFSGTETGVVLYNSTGTQLGILTGVSGNRGVYQLPTGNYLTTSGSGIHEIDDTTGALVRTIVAGVSGRFIREYDLSIVPVELTSFSANVNGNTIVLNWSTATETNNYGFQIERSLDSRSFEQIGFVQGAGTTTELRFYSFADNSVTGGTYFYRLKQIDYDGSYDYSNVVEVDMGVPQDYSLEQNYPNPFNPSTTIQFSLPVDANVTLGIYNLVGEKVDDVVSENLHAGFHKLNYSADNLTSGIYFYRMDAAGVDGANFTSVKKMTLLK